MKSFKDVYFNMNNPVTVLLTEQGVSFLENHHKHRREWHLAQSLGERDIGEFIRPENNLYKTSMWNMIDIFGKLEMWELDQHISMEVTLGSVSISEQSFQQSSGMQFKVEALSGDVGPYRHILEPFSPEWSYEIDSDYKALEDCVKATAVIKLSTCEDMISVIEGIRALNTGRRDHRGSNKDNGVIVEKSAYDEYWMMIIFDSYR